MYYISYICSDWLVELVEHCRALTLYTVSEGFIKDSIRKPATSVPMVLVEQVEWGSPQDESYKLMYANFIELTCT